MLLSVSVPPSLTVLPVLLTSVGASSSKMMIPSCSSEIPSSFSEQAIDDDSTPRIFARLILRSPGRVVPTVATATLSPARTLGAPHTICSASPAPVWPWSETPRPRSSAAGPLTAIASGARSSLTVPLLYKDELLGVVD